MLEAIDADWMRGLWVVGALGERESVGGWLGFVDGVVVVGCLASDGFGLGVVELLRVDRWFCCMGQTGGGSVGSVALGSGMNDGKGVDGGGGADKFGSVLASLGLLWVIVG